MGEVFNVYAQYYDLLYRDKNYINETDYIIKNITQNFSQAKSILELGCGTGAHAEHLANNGFVVHGIDQSETMLIQAESRKKKLPDKVSGLMNFSHGDIRTVNTNKKYDVVVSLFHVMSYQTTDNDFAAAIETASKHLNSGGLFLFDFWYGPAVQLQNPEMRVKRLENDDIKVTRIAEPEIHENINVVDVGYDIFIEQKNEDKITQVQEKHAMRYIFLEDLERFIKTDVWEGFDTYSWLSKDKLNEKSWSGFIVAKHL